MTNEINLSITSANPVKDAAKIKAAIDSPFKDKNGKPIALRSFVDWMGTSYQVVDFYLSKGLLILNDASEAIPTECEIISYPVPAIGSRWLNNRRKKSFTVHGVVSHCEGDEWEVLYRSDDMPEGQFRRRSLESWHGTNRDGQPRFVDVGGRGAPAYPPAAPVHQRTNIQP
jgi:hypothetical protein